MTRPVLAIVLASADPRRAPLVNQLVDLSKCYEIHAVVLDGTAPSVSSIVIHSLRDLGLEPAAVRFALDDEELAVLVRPRFLRTLWGSADVVSLDGMCVLRDPTRPLFTTAPSGFCVVPLVPWHVAKRKPSLHAAFEAGLGQATGQLLRIGDEVALIPLLERWREWVDEAYSGHPMTQLQATEQTWLTTVPAISSDAHWCHDVVHATWGDVDNVGGIPDVVDLRGLAEHLELDGPDLRLISRRTHSARGLGSVLSLLPDVPVVQSERVWRGGAEAGEVARRTFRSRDPMGVRWADPTSGADGHAFRCWLQARDERGLARWEHLLYWSRPDLRQSFPPSTPVRVFSRWLREAGVAPDLDGAPDPVGFGGRALGAARRRAAKLAGRSEPLLSSRRAAPQNPAMGVNLIGFARAESGLGEAMRSTVGALRRLSVPTAVVDVGHRIYSRSSAGEPERTIGSPYDITVIHLNPEELLGYASDDLSFRVASPWVIGYWFWETDELPQRWLPAFDAVDEIWAASTFLEDVFRRYTDKPITKIGLAVEVPEGVRADRGRFGVPEDAFVITYITDAYSGLQRKDPRAAIEAFRRAFGAGAGGEHLVLKVSNLEKFPAYRRALHEECRDLPVTIVADYLSRDEVWHLLAGSDTYLSLHAAEGYGLTIVEAMALGVPVIATDFGGSTDFADSESALLVRFTKRPAEGGPADVYSGHGSWAKPDVAHAADQLRRARADAALRARLAAAGRRRAREAAPEAHDRRVARRLQDLGLTGGNAIAPTS